MCANQVLSSLNEDASFRRSLSSFQGQEIPSSADLDSVNDSGGILWRFAIALVESQANDLIPFIKRIVTFLFSSCYHVISILVILSWSFCYCRFFDTESDAYTVLTDVAIGNACFYS